MLRLLLDEHLSPRIARELAASEPSLFVVSLRDWEEGAYLAAPDGLILTQAYRQGLTLVTYDQRTIAPLLKSLGEQGVFHGGVVLVDVRTLAPDDLGGLARALLQLWTATNELDWTDRVVYLQRG